MNKPNSLSYHDAIRISSRLSGIHRLIFDFSIESGLRISDVLNLKARYIAKIMYIKERKTKKHKIIEISDELLKRMRPLINFNRQAYAFRSPRTPYKPLHRSTYHLHLKKACRALDVNISAHSARKLHAVNLFQRTQDIFAVQKALNHKYITTTCAYLDIDIAKLINAQSATDPT